jgi:DNA-binding GntR family transcriptional regulator
MEGLIHLEAHRTMIITPLTSQELDERYAIRTELDPFAAGLAAANVSESQLALIQRLARQKTAGDPILQLERNREFHRAVYASCGNAALIGLLEQLWDRTDRYRLILIREELLDGSTSRQEHIELADALAARRSDLASSLMRAHIERPHTRIASVMMTWAADRTERPGKGRWATNDQRRRDRSDLGKAPRRAGHRGSVRVGFQPIRAIT